MRGYEEDEYDDAYLDEYEEEGEEQEEAAEDEYEEEEEEPSPELLEYLELRQRLKEDIRKQMKKELGTASRQTSNKPKDNYGSFFGPSQPVISQRVIQESKSLLENPNLAAKLMKCNPSSNKSSTSKPAGSKTTTTNNAPKVQNGLKRKSEILKKTRDYSFLLSDDAELPAPSKGPLTQKVSAPNCDARLVKHPSGKQASTGGKLLNDREVKKGGQMQPKAMIQKPVSIGKPTQPIPESRKQYSSSNGSGSGPGRPLGPKGAPSKSNVPAMHRPGLSKLQPSASSQSSVQNRVPLQSGKSKVMHKQGAPISRPQAVIQRQPVPSSRPQIKTPPSEERRPALHQKEERRPTLQQKVDRRPVVQSKDDRRPVVPKKEDRRPTLNRNNDRRPARKPMGYDDDADEAISMIRNMFRYNPSRYHDDDDVSDMEANFDDILREERISAQIARKEDEEEQRKIEEEERRERLRKQAKKRKLSHQ